MIHIFIKNIIRDIFKSNDSLLYKQLDELWNSINKKNDSICTPLDNLVNVNINVNSICGVNVEIKVQNKVQNDINEIVSLFFKKVKNQDIIIENKNDGSEGKWLEHQFGIKPNSKNEPDLFGYELKKYSKKITLGDFSASEYPFSSEKVRKHISLSIPRTTFIQIFGEPNPMKQNRYSWSGSCVPSYANRDWNNCGQRMIITDQGDISIYYSFQNDQRERKHVFPDEVKKENILIAFWDRMKLEANIENKFNQKGFFICKKKDRVYNSIHFGHPFTFSFFIEAFKKGDIIFDSGMYETNPRPYSQFRAKDEFWMNMIYLTY